MKRKKREKNIRRLGKLVSELYEFDHRFEARCALQVMYGLLRLRDAEEVEARERRMGL